MSCPHGEWHQCDICDEIDAAYKRGYEEGGKVSIDLTLKHLQRAEKAETERDEFRKDAERHRWLRKEIEHGPLCIFKCGDYDVTSWSGDDLDAAIDQARNK